MRVKSKLIVAGLCFCLSLSPLVGCAASEPKKNADFSGISSVCELATLKCYYHNVAESREEASGIFGGLLGTGYKKLWMEYSGIVEVGIDVAQVQISQPTEEGVVRVHIPDAQILSISLDKDSLSDPLVDAGLFTEVSMEEKTNAVASAQENMEETARQNTSMLAQAKERAKRTIEGYIVNAGRAIGETYIVEWE
ncbi:DUF4230 domain-containing protein [Adlercreutzia equolifaciens]|uniref:DUF4230 domain-containing protein n=1 Tax=Adlercreutzia equolifaciens TaxID=446660 RepID=UPI0023AFFE8E|nr:DUF4230 domain-containing protein [Adlercreutzia equolifaciens]